MPRDISAPLHVQRRLSALWVRHLDDLDIRCLRDIAHRLRSDEDELPTNRASSSLDDHMHTPFAVDAVHEDVTGTVSWDRKSASLNNLQFVQAANRRTHCIPEREEKTHSRVRLLTSR
jgi:hypothetical protein